MLVLIFVRRIFVNIFSSDNFRPAIFRRAFVLIFSCVSVFVHSFFFSEFHYTYGQLFVLAFFRLPNFSPVHLFVYIDFRHSSVHLFVYPFLHLPYFSSIYFSFMQFFVRTFFVSVFFRALIFRPAFFRSSIFFVWYFLSIHFFVQTF